MASKEKDGLYTSYCNQDFSSRTASVGQQLLHPFPWEGAHWCAQSAGSAPGTPQQLPAAKACRTKAKQRKELCRELQLSSRSTQSHLWMSMRWSWSSKSWLGSPELQGTGAYLAEWKCRYTHCICREAQKGKSCIGVYDVHMYIFYIFIFLRKHCCCLCPLIYIYLFLVQYHLQ